MPSRKSPLHFECIQLDILDYCKRCETSSLQVAQEELGELDLDWEQLKIMRIKFLSEFGM